MVIGGAYSFNRKKPGWSVVSEHIKKQAPLEVRQSWARLGKVGQSWAKLGKEGQSQANRNVVTVVWKPRRAFDFCPVIVTSLTGAGKCYLLHTQIRRIMPSAADNHIMPSFSRISEIYLKWKLRPITYVYFCLHICFFGQHKLYVKF